MLRGNSNIPGGAKAIGDLLWPSALACRQAASVVKNKKVTLDPVFHKFLPPDSGPKKTQNLSGVDSRSPESWPPVIRSDDRAGMDSGPIIRFLPELDPVSEF